MCPPSHTLFLNQRTSENFALPIAFCDVLQSDSLLVYGIFFFNESDMSQFAILIVLRIPEGLFLMFAHGCVYKGITFNPLIAFCHRQAFLIRC